MLIRSKGRLTENDVTPESIYRDRRRFMQLALAGTAMAATPLSQAKPGFVTDSSAAQGPRWLEEGIAGAQAYGQEVKDKLTPYKHVTSYNNFYEFGYDKADPAEHAHTLKPHPWQVEVSGHAEKTGTFNLEDILAKVDLVERVYRLRCVEAWSMVIPWVGFELGQLLKQFAPTSRAKYVAFETLHAPDQMRAQDSVFSSIEWPYVEGLRMDEAMHPLTLLAVGLYGKPVPNQNGAPLRLVVPWKYGFKSIKSIVKISFTEQEPPTSWNISAPREYGFYANVNPSVSHPRWSQATERRLPSGLFSPNIIDTQMFNGYQEEVADLYKGMDLTKYY
ncbi:protein-methionine-sulfoxide reductase catalytic subunit MsrP [Gilvimarinus sp. SDUM040013]|uniref:Protein-methionine-sulfoxide reductase catalytic subunit MsrP n=1 Tax=Gilvimarinus gilvus TaxID=3058038 RepID=A0ABU4S4P8_9GAMM|nr:protein-methionine-sulfoxide reductase catalytic subunit MsrP [Gilvimarinus sp. SDUM040013]MDO3384829.1 protein-methionine-sulfoxide reductase catalytic subunit MsrP [Gilvimarinus sp. SDUM040013]MDX6850838.1 protein-methionine-sulfoxide reductase catalytic subunit MsrP [Gilvimarinus sp. SDUM040013]